MKKTIILALFITIHTQQMHCIQDYGAFVLGAIKIYGLQVLQCWSSYSNGTQKAIADTHSNCISKILYQKQFATKVNLYKEIIDFVTINAHNIYDKAQTANSTEAIINFNTTLNKTNYVIINKAVTESSDIAHSEQADLLLKRTLNCLHALKTVNATTSTECLKNMENI